MLPDLLVLLSSYTIVLINFPFNVNFQSGKKECNTTSEIVRAKKTTSPCKRFSFFSRRLLQTNNRSIAIAKSSLNNSVDFSTYHSSPPNSSTDCIFDEWMHSTNRAPQSKKNENLQLQRNKWCSLVWTTCSLSLHKWCIFLPRCLRTSRGAAWGEESAMRRQAAQR